MKRTLYWLIGILTLAVFLRFYQLGSIPASPDWDETALGYNAYSILKTGRDEYGTFLPLAIRSFDDYKPPLYTYLTVPSVGVFGLSVWSTRLPSAVFGVLAVLGVYFLAKEIFDNEKNVEQLALISALLLAISPWHIQFSRIAFEANTGVTLNIWAVAVFLMGIRKKIYLPLSASLFALALYAYHSERIFVPLLVVLLGILYRKEVFSGRYRTQLGISVAIGCLIVAPLVPVLFSKSGMLRLQGTSSFSNQTELLKRTVVKLDSDRKNGDIAGLFLDNRRFLWVKTVWQGYLSHFSLRWLFLAGDNPRHHAPDMGELYLWELPFFLCGLYIICMKRRNRNKWLILGWFLLAPVAASPTTGLPHSVRTLVFLPTFQILTAVGVLAVLRRLSVFSMPLRSITYTLMFIFISMNIAYYLNMYFVHMNAEYSEFWQYGYENAVKYTELHKDKYRKIVVSTGLEQSYMFFLFYTKYDPATYLAGGGTLSGGFDEVKNRFDKYEFRKINWATEKREKGVLYVGSSNEMPHGNVMNFKFLNGKAAIEMADFDGGFL